MPKNDHIGTTKQITNSSYCLHKNAASFRITQYWCIINTLARLFTLPNFIPNITNHGKLKLVIFLGQCSHHDTFHHRIAVLKAIPQTSCRWVNYYIFALDTKVTKQNIQLFCQVYINGRGRNDSMIIAKSTGGNALIVSFFNRSKCEIFPFV